MRRIHWAKYFLGVLIHSVCSEEIGTLAKVLSRSSYVPTYLIGGMSSGHNLRVPFIPDRL